MVVSCGQIYEQVKSEFLILFGLRLCNYSFMKIKNLACKAPNTTDPAGNFLELVCPLGLQPWTLHKNRISLDAAHSESSPFK